jgi:predicted enzyme related to lactoylglutathione lyase
MEADVLFAGVPVSDFTTARAWYERFFGRPADLVAHEYEVLWQVTGGGWLYVVRDPDRAGRASVAIAVQAIDEAVAGLRARGVSTGPIEPQGETARKAIALDPDANSIAIIQVVGTT